MKKEFQKNIFPFALFALVIFTDQLSKHIIRQLGGFYICNSGIAFGIKGAWLCLALLLVVIIIFWKRKQIASLFVGYSLLVVVIFSGGISNLIDRLRFGCVIDFIDLRFWPVFNLADTFIFMGGFFILMKTLRDRKA